MCLTRLRQLDAELRELTFDDRRPAAVRIRICWARVQDASDPARLAGKRRPRPLLGESPDADDDFGLEHAHDAAERVVAHREERLLLGARQLVGRTVASAFLDERQRTVVRDEEAREEALRRAETVPRPSPEALAADLRTGTLEPEHRTLRVHV